MKTRVRLVGPSTVDLIATGDDFAARIEVPAGLPLGTYQMYVHNGAGGNYAWSDPIGVTIAQQSSWPQALFNVTTFGAQGDGVADDTEAVRRALAQAGANGGGVVVFPRGNYALSGTLTVPRGTVLRGEKQEWVCLAWPDFANPPPAFIQGSNSFGLQNLTLYAGNCQQLILGDSGHGPQSGNIFLGSVRVRANQYGVPLTSAEVDERFKASLGNARYLVKLGGMNVVITNCDFYGSSRPLFLSRARGCRIAGNRFYNGRWGWYCLGGSDGLIFENNLVQGCDLMSSGGGVNVLDGSTSSQNVYFASNHLSLFHGWDREAMTTDGGGAAYFGKIRSVNGSTFETAHLLTNSISDFRGAGVFILAGRGAGQFRRLADYSGTSVTLDAPWRRDPDANSDISITMLQQRHLIIGNDFTDTGPAQFFGTAVESIMSSNQGKRMRGFWGTGLWYFGYQPNWFCQFLDNRISEGNYYHFTNVMGSVIGVSGSTYPPYDGPLNWGTVVRRNQFDNNSGIMVWGSCRDVLLERNFVQNSADGIVVGSEPAGVLLRGNRFLNVTVPISSESYLRQASEDSAMLSATGQPLVAWTFESLEADQFEDVTGNGFPAILEGSVVQAPRVGSARAALFDGTGYLVASQSSVIFNMPDLTVSLWLKPLTLKGRRGLIVKRFASIPSPFVLFQRDDSIAFEAADETGKWSFGMQSPPVLSTNTWTHVVVTAQQGLGAILYVNGMQSDSVINETKRAVNSEPLLLGREAWGGSPPIYGMPGFYVGLMDEIQIWPRALTPVEVAELYASRPLPPTGVHVR